MNLYVCFVNIKTYLDKTCCYKFRPIVEILVMCNFNSFNYF
jgi:hypothetical protein